MTFNAYLKAIRENLQRGDSTEHTHRPALKVLVEALEKRITATNEPKRVECGAPDYVVSRSTKHGPLTIGYIEAKDVGKSLDEAERSEQIKRYLPLGNLILTDYLEFRWYVDSEHRQTACLGRLGKGGKIVADKEGKEEVKQLLTSFLDRKPPPIDKPKDLAERLARLTHLIRDIIEEAFEKEQASTIIKDLHRAFEEVLIPDLAIPQFADMFAQTLAYGLFAARCNHQGPPESFQRLGAADEIPKTNPFLRKLFEMITGTAIDEEPFVGFVDDLVQLLRHTDIGAVLSDFGKRTRREDPIIHFYETFLAEYNPIEREMRGVYYTPDSIVSYIVRSIDHLLKSRFGCPGGLADSTTVEYAREDDEGKERTETAPRVLILDPACGTGTFLYTVVDLIREEFMRRGDAGMWSGYVQKHLLPRLFGFELLMAPYAVAHLKLGMQLAGQDLPEAQRKDWAYDFAGEDRLPVYLTNALEEEVKRSEILFARWIAEEGEAAAKIKRELPIMVVLGNPPYSGHSANRSWREVINPKTGKKRRESTWIGGLIQDYYQVDGQPLGERNPKWLQDDYVKFIRFAQWRLEETDQGILGFVTNHSYLDNPTFRGMRQSLMESFSEIHVLDLHGSTRKRERAPDGGRDEPVFDIQQGVAIILAVREPDRAGPAKVLHLDIYGLRDEKERFLGDHDLKSTDWTTLEPRSPYYLFVDMDYGLAEEYERGWKVTEAMPVNGVGMTTARDHVVVDFDEEPLLERATLFRDSTDSDAELCRQLKIPQKKGWNIPNARKLIREETNLYQHIEPVLYRPFDKRLIFYHDSLVWRTVRQVMSHILSRENLGICIGRAGQVIGAEDWDILFCTRNITEFNLYRRGGNNLFPLYLYPSEKGEKILRVNIIEAAKKKIRDSGLVEKVNVGSEQDRVVELICKLFPEELPRWPNLGPDFIADLTRRLRLKFLPDGTGDLKKTFGPEDIFHYMYAVFHSPTYRTRYSEFLKIDFPRLPLTSDKKLFSGLAEMGRELVGLHLMDSPSLEEQRTTSYPVPGDDMIEKGHPKYFAPGDKPPGGTDPLTEGRVYIGRDDKKTEKRGQYFEGVHPEVWEFHVGGYQVSEKWLKDRRGRNLSHEDLIHYQKIVVSLQETIRLMAEIDQIIPSWPIQ